MNLTVLRVSALLLNFYHPTSSDKNVYEAKGEKTLFEKMFLN